MSAIATTDRVYNFSAGPAVLPVSVLETIQRDMMSLPGIGSSILEISHRSADFVAIFNDAKQRLVDLLGVPETHDVLFVQGGSRLQNAMIPMNFITDVSQTADYVVTGSWGKKSAEEVHRFGNLNVAYDGKSTNYNSIPEDSQINHSSDAAYFHYTSNETIHGVQFDKMPNSGGAPVVCDCSSDFLYRPLDVSSYGMIYACAQKNAGIAGVTIVVIEKALMERAKGRLPGYLEFSAHAGADSMFNTPPTFAIYVFGLVCKWLQENVGGLEAMKKLNLQKSQLLYDLIDKFPEFYIGHAVPSARSHMNVVFQLPTKELETEFLAQAKSNDMTTLKGHRSIGGIRASIYNAMPIEGVQQLASFMSDFASKQA